MRRFLTNYFCDFMPQLIKLVFKEKKDVFIKLIIIINDAIFLTIKYNEIIIMSESNV